MPIGDSKGAFYEDEFRQVAAPWFIDPKMEGDEKSVVDPKSMQTNKQLDKAELDPTTGIGIEVSSDEIDWNAYNKPTGEMSMTDVGDSPVQRQVDDFKKQANGPAGKLDDPEALQQAMDLGMAFSGGGLATRIVPKYNYRTQIDKYTDKLYRESSLQEGLEHFPKEPSTASTSFDRKFYADHPDMATGQGSNKGITLEYSSKGFEGQINTSKPLWEPAYENGFGEYLAQPMVDPKGLVKGIKIDTDFFKDAPKWVAARYRTAMQRLVDDGWTKTKEGNIIHLKKPE